MDEVIMLDRKLSLTQGILLYIIVVVLGYMVITNLSTMLSLILTHLME
jgi:uncharacterized membrane protein